MDRMFVVIFESVDRARKGYAALGDLHGEGSIVLYAVALIARDCHGRVTVEQAPDQGRFGAILAVATGNLIKLLANPLGVAGVTESGVMVNPDLDLAGAGTEIGFLDEVRVHFLPGTAGLIAEVDEDRVNNVNRKMAEFGGKVLRSVRKELLGALIEQNISALEKELQELEAEFSESTGATKLDLQDKIENRQVDLLINTSRAKLRAEELTREAAAKIVFLQEQAARMDGGRRAKLEELISAVRVDYAERTRTLNRVWLTRAEYNQYVKSGRDISSK